jgi:multiple sugar transport system ATP-binding protein
MVERLGNETIVNLELPSGASWLAVLDGDQALKRGESLALDVDPGKALLFDRDGRLVAA